MVRQLYAVILLTFIEFLGFAAMTTKTWSNPESESLGYSLSSILKYIFWWAALDLCATEVILYPAATAMMIFYRRLQRKKWTE